MAKLKSYDENKCVYLKKKDGWCPKAGLICPNNPDHCFWYKCETEKTEECKNV